METETVVSERAAQPIPRQPVRDRRTSRVEWIGAVRLPIAGPYCPLARLYQGTDGTLRWRVRLWEADRPVERTFETDVLRTFARVNGLHDLEDRIEVAVARARRREHP